MKRDCTPTALTVVPNLPVVCVVVALTGGVMLGVFTANNMEKALEMAIKGGWKGEGAKFNSYVPEYRDIHWSLADGYAQHCSLEEALLDPKFFQALGKAMGLAQHKVDVEVY